MRPSRPGTEQELPKPSARLNEVVVDGPIEEIGEGQEAAKREEQDRDDTRHRGDRRHDDCTIAFGATPKLPHRHTGEGNRHQYRSSPYQLPGACTGEPDGDGDGPEQAATEHGACPQGAPPDGYDVALGWSLGARAHVNGSGRPPRLSLA
jgi:hypothetical protein